MAYYYALTIFLSAFLLFQIQPLISKYILPWFGGTPAVWSTAMLFFQVLLLGGYTYAYGLGDRLPTRKQGIVHLMLLGFSLGLLLVTALAWASPLTPDASWKPHGTEAPVWHILSLLAVSVGLPYFILSTNSPLMQAWFHHAYPGRSPYRLYALSNIGSLLALISYPFLIEPLLALKTQAKLWTAGYVIFAVCAGYGAFRMMRRRANIDEQQADPDTRSLADEATRPRAGLYVLWTALAACASVMLLAVTSQITQEVAVIPFLWILPLTLYLLSFILCFSSDRWYSRPGYAIALLVSSVLYCWILALVKVAVVNQIFVYSLLLFSCCMICHGELVRLKPHPRYLTSFYLMTAAGGAIGGSMVTLIAPHIFTGFWELPLGLLGCWVLLLVASQVNKPATQTRRQALFVAALVMSIIAGLSIVLFSYIQMLSTNVLEASRNFYGVLRVQEANTNSPDQRSYVLVHGATLHGFQFQEGEKRRQPTAYFTEDSGVGLALLHHPKRDSGLRVGIVGLGVGTLAAYGRPGDTFRFYEINPDVIRLAEGAGGYFTYLKDCPAQKTIVPGDARLSLERELAAGEPHRFDLLVIDAFNSDAIPVHLLTEEAFATYLEHLQPDGILALNITNRHLDLRPVVWELADHFQLDTALVETPGDNKTSYTSSWILATRNVGFLNLPAIASRSTPRPQGTSHVRLWTDDYSNLFQLLR